MPAASDLSTQIVNSVALTPSSSITESFLVAAKPTIPALFARHDASLCQRARLLAKIQLIPQDRLRIAEFRNLQLWSAISGDAIETYENIGSQAAAIPCGLHLRRVGDVVNSGVRPFQNHVAPAGALVLTVYQDSTLQPIEVLQVEHVHRKPRIGDWNPMHSQRLLPIGGVLRRT